MDLAYLKTFLTDIARAKSRLAGSGRPARYCELNGADHDYIKTLGISGVTIVGGGLVLAGIPAGPSPQVAANEFRLLDEADTLAYDSRLG